ncbi:MAG: rod-binding protein [Smithellaceae bacterium]|nr:rod-binding protein [Smithellaceae bacterium]
MIEINNNLNVIAGPKGLHDDRINKERDKQLEKACQDFEAIFVYKILQALRKTVPTAGMSKMPGKATYEMLMDQKIAEDFSKKGGGMGLGRLLYEKMSRLE